MLESCHGQLRAALSHGDDVSRRDMTSACMTKTGRAKTKKGQGETSQRKERREKRKSRAIPNRKFIRLGDDDVGIDSCYTERQLGHG